MPDLFDSTSTAGLTAEVERWLRGRFATLCHNIGQPGPSSALRISPSLADWEAFYFVRGLEEYIFALDEQGGVTSELLRSSAEAAGPPSSYRLFSREPPRLLRENVCQLGTAARLIVERGWPRKNLVLGPSRAGHRATAEGYDLSVRLRADEILIAVEIRRSRLELEKLIADLRACSRRGPHAHSDCGFPQNHPRHEFCISERPAYLWAVAPDGEICCEVRYKGSSLDLESLSSLPPRSLLELA
jgi:hypothetical protein